MWRRSREGRRCFFINAPSEVEVLNDLDGEIVNFFRVCQWHHEELLRYFRFVLVSRKWFELLRATDPGMLTDVQRAARYMYLSEELLMRASSEIPATAGKWSNRPASTSNASPSSLKMPISDWNGCRSSAFRMKRFCGGSTGLRHLFYLDPPYLQRKLYRYNFEDAEFAKAC